MCMVAYCEHDKKKNLKVIVHHFCTVCNSTNGLVSLIFTCSGGLVKKCGPRHKICKPTISSAWRMPSEGTELYTRASWLPSATISSPSRVSCHLSDCSCSQVITYRTRYLQLRYVHLAYIIHPLWHSHRPESWDSSPHPRDPGDPCLKTKPAQSYRHFRSPQCGLKPTGQALPPSFST